MKIEISKATSQDIPTILHFMKDYYRIEQKSYDKEKSASSLDFLLNHPDIGSLWMILMDRKKIGYFCLAYNFSLDMAGRDCFLDEIYISPQYRGLGIGSMVMDQIIQYLRALDFKGIHLLVYHFNESAISFYKKNGFSAENGKFMTLEI